jgi:hypothetical protein
MRIVRLQETNGHVTKKLVRVTISVRPLATSGELLPFLPSYVSSVSQLRQTIYLHQRTVSIATNDRKLMKAALSVIKLVDRR